MGIWKFSIGNDMNTINKQLDKELFEDYYRLLLLPHLRLRPRLHLPLYFSDKVFNQLDNLYIGWDYRDSVLELI